MMEQKKTMEELIENKKALTPREKLLLLQKLQHPTDPSEKAEVERRFWSSYGGWKGDETAEELVESIYNSRTAAPERERLI